MSEQQESLFARFQQAMDSPPVSHQKVDDSTDDLDLDKITAEILAHHHVDADESDDKVLKAKGAGNDSLGPSLQSSAAEEEATKDFKSFPAPLVHSTGNNHASYNQAHSSLAQRSALENKPLGVVPTHIPKVVNFPAKTSSSSSSRSLLRKDSSSASKVLAPQQKTTLLVGESTDLNRSTGSNRSTTSNSNNNITGSTTTNLPGEHIVKSEVTLNQSTDGGAQQQQQQQQQRNVRYRHPVDPVAQAKAQKEVQEQLLHSSAQQQQQQHVVMMNQPAQPTTVFQPQQQQPQMVGGAVVTPQFQNNIAPPQMMHQQQQHVPIYQHQQQPAAAPGAPGAMVPMQGYYVTLPNGQVAFQPVIPIQ